MKNEYWLELLEKGLWIFPVKGIGKTKDDAKKPICEWKNEEAVKLAREYASKSHNAFACWLLRSGLFGIDIDYKHLSNEERSSLPKLDKLMDDLGVYVEKTAGKGRHYIFKADRKWKLVTKKEGVEYKSDGYFIIAPSVLKTPERDYRYEFLNDVKIYEAVDIEAVKTDVEEALSEFFKVEVKVEEDIVAFETPETIKIESLGLDVNDLNFKQVDALLYLIFSEAECDGLAKAVEYIDESRVVPVRKKLYSMMNNPRTTRWLFQYSLACVMAYLGFSLDKIYEYLMSFKFIDEDEDPRNDSTGNVVYNLQKYGLLDLVPRGACPWCWMLCKKPSCDSTPLKKVMRIPRDTIERMLEFVRENV